MRVHTRVVWQWRDGVLVELPEEGDSYDYEGPVALAGSGTPNVNQLHCRARSDTNTPAGGTPTWLSVAEDQNFYIPLDTTFRIRILLQNTGSAAQATTFQLWYSRNGGGYQIIGGQGTTVLPVIASAAASTVNETAIPTTDFLLSAGAGTPAAGTYVEVPNIVTNIDAGTYTEFEWGIILDSNNTTPAQNGDTFDFRVYLSSEAPINGYTVTIRATAGTGAANLSPPIYTDADTFYAPVIGRGARDLAPGLVTDGEVFGTPSVARVNPLTAPYVIDGELFYAPTVGRGVRNVTAALVTDADLFYAPTVGRGAVNATAGLVVDADQIFAPTVASSNAVSLSTLADADLFYAPTIGRGAVDLGLTVHADPDLFYAPEVALEGGAEQAVTVDALYSDADAFYAPAVAPGPVGLTLSTFVDGDTFYAPTATPGAVSLTAALVTDADLFYAPVAAPGAMAITAAFLDDADQFFAPSAAYQNSLAATTVVDADTFFAAVVEAPGALQTLRLPLWEDADSFFSPSVGRGEVAVTASLYQDPDVFYAPVAGRGLSPSLYSDADVFFAPEVVLGAGAEQALQAQLWADPDVIYAPTIARAAVVEEVVVPAEEEVGETGGKRKPKRPGGRFPKYDDSIARYFEQRRLNEERDARDLAAIMAFQREQIRLALGGTHDT